MFQGWAFGVSFQLPRRDEVASKLFGHEATKHEILYGHRTSKTTKPVYAGASELLLKLLHEEADSRKSLDLTEMKKGGGFVARMLCTQIKVGKRWHA